MTSIYTHATTSVGQHEQNAPKNQTIEQIRYERRARELDRCWEAKQRLLREKEAKQAEMEMPWADDHEDEMAEIRRLTQRKRTVSKPAKAEPKARLSVPKPANAGPKTKKRKVVSKTHSERGG